MAALTVDELIAEQARMLPPEFGGVPEVLAVYAGAQAEAGESVDVLLSQVKITTAAGKWLDLIARTYGLRRGADETDTDLRARLLTFDQAVTPAGIVAAVNALLVTYTATPAFLVEHYTQGAVCDEETAGPPMTGVCDAGSWLWDTSPGWTLYVPSVLTASHPVWAAIFDEVERTRPAGVPWFYVLDDEPVTIYP